MNFLKWIRVRSTQCVSQEGLGSPPSHLALALQSSNSSKSSNAKGIQTGRKAWRAPAWDA